MTEPFEADKWNVFFKPSTHEPYSESRLEVIFKLKRDPRQVSRIEQNELEELEEDLKDLGKWRRFKELKKDLET